VNERIQQLVEQARKYARDYVADCKHYGHYIEHNELEVKFEEKFAELIVRESADYVQFYYKDHACEIIAHDMKTHFGVEE
jgi:hypothetical protein